MGTINFAATYYPKGTPAPLALAAAEAFSLDPLYLHHDAILHDHRHLAELQTHQGPANVLDRGVELSRVASVQRRQLGQWFV